MDISESGKLICEKLFTLLDDKQRYELIQFVLKQEDTVVSEQSPSSSSTQACLEQKSTEIQREELYFCLESRTVFVRNNEIGLTSREFDILALLIMNPNRVFTYEMIMEIVWHEKYDFYSRKAINNHVSNLRKKLKIFPDIPDYIKNVHSIGYKFNSNIDII